uniref:Uncharacterized protein n=1 Tax=Ditylenchus dipsaci TaxID=166011 RepID=A0A915D2R5_9BILA
MVGQYMESWLAKASVVQQQQDGIPNVCSHMFVLKECPAVSNAQFEKECRRRSLDYSQGMPSLMPAMTTKAVNYSIHRVESIKEFMVTLTTSANNNSIQSSVLHLVIANSTLPTT